MIENCLIEGKIEVSSKDYVAGLVGKAMSTKLSKIVNYVSVKAGSSNYVGGIAGRSEGKITYDSNHATISSNYYGPQINHIGVGGIAGYVVAKSYGLHNVFNEGTIVRGNIRGGIAGYIVSGANGDVVNRVTPSLKSVYNIGTVDAHSYSLVRAMAGAYWRSEYMVISDVFILNGQYALENNNDYAFGFKDSRLIFEQIMIEKASSSAIRSKASTILDYQNPGSNDLENVMINTGIWSKKSSVLSNKIFIKGLFWETSSEQPKIYLKSYFGYLGEDGSGNVATSVMGGSGNVTFANITGSVKEFE